MRKNGGAAAHGERRRARVKPQHDAGSGCASSKRGWSEQP